MIYSKILYHFKNQALEDQQISIEFELKLLNIYGHKVIDGKKVANITADSTFHDLIPYCKRTAVWEKQLNDKKQLSTNWKDTLEIWMLNIMEQLLSEWVDKYENKFVQFNKKRQISVTPLEQIDHGRKEWETFRRNMLYDESEEGNQVKIYDVIQSFEYNINETELNKLLEDLTSCIILPQFAESWLNLKSEDILSPNKYLPKVEIANLNNDEIKKTITEFFKKFENEFLKSNDYLKAIEVIINFLLEKPINIELPLKMKTKNIKKLAFSLGEIWRIQKTEAISYEYLLFYKQVFSPFKDHLLDKEQHTGSSLYKYSISMA